MQVFARENVALQHLMPDTLTAKAERQVEAESEASSDANKVLRTQ
jgi:hypothetical protein